MTLMCFAAGSTQMQLNTDVELLLSCPIKVKAVLNLSHKLGCIT